MSAKHYFICGIGGSGMLPLAIILKGMGFMISGSDRSYDQGRTPEKFQWIKEQEIVLHPQDGSGITTDISAVAISKAVENSIPDIIAANAKNIPVIRRVDVMTDLFNDSGTRIAIAGTSGKTTTTGMTGFLLKEAGMDPTVMNGGVFRNYANENPYSTAFVGAGDVFVSEVDESDGKDAVCAYNLDIAVVHNISLDHQPMPELKEMFSGFLFKGKNGDFKNTDDNHVLEVARGFQGRVVTYSAVGSVADLTAHDFIPHPDGIEAKIATRQGQIVPLKLKLPGRHNISNALAALSVGLEMGLDLPLCTEILSRFEGIRRRMEITGSVNGITVMDDFAHNPDKIAATLGTLREFPGRLIVFFQPHGYGFLKLVWEELARTFIEYLADDDRLYLVEPLYLGGTVDRAVSSADLAAAINKNRNNAYLMNNRSDAGEAIVKNAEPGDRIIIMGARDDSLSTFARNILASLK